MENFDDDIARMLALSALEPESGELPKIRLNKTIPADKKVIKQMMSVLTPQQFISLYQSNPNTKAMKFTVTRTSDRHNANKPCNNAVCVKPYEPERFNGHNYADSEGQSGNRDKHTRRLACADRRNESPYNIGLRQQQ